LVTLPIAVGDLATAIAGCPIGKTTLIINSVGNLSDASPTTIAAYFDRRYQSDAQHTQAGAVLVTDAMASDLPSHITRIVVSDARRAWHQLLRFLFPLAKAQLAPAGIHDSANVSVDALVHHSAKIGPFVTIEAGARIDADVSIGHGCFVGRDSKVGERTVLSPHCTILAGVLIGEECWLGPGVRMGSLGFGLDEHGRCPHIGGVKVGSRVSIGANTCIDSGTVSPTQIGDNSHIDNLVQIGHNVQLGEGVIVCGLVGISGSSRIKDGVVIGGQAGVAGHVTVGPKARIAAQSGVTKSLEGHTEYSGHPAEPNIERLRRMAVLKRLGKT
jgi:UDP-3-O-[3-hydroxymyristoyl] glucosamine N-acyltransferase